MWNYSAELPGQPLIRPRLYVSHHPWRRSSVHTLQSGRHLHKVRVWHIMFIILTNKFVSHQMPNPGSQALLVWFWPRAVSVPHVGPGELHHRHQVRHRRFIFCLISRNIYLHSFMIFSGYHSSTRLVPQFLEQRWKVWRFIFVASFCVFGLFLVTFAQTSDGNLHKPLTWEAFSRHALIYLL